MECADLCSFWNKNEGSIAKALPEGTVALADSLKTGAEKFKLTQKIDGDIISWSNQEDKTVLMYCLIPDPRDLDRVLDAYVQTQARKCLFTIVLVDMSYLKTQTMLAVLFFSWLPLLRCAGVSQFALIPALP